MEGARRLERTELSVFGKPQPGTQRIVSRAKDFRAPGRERSKPPVRTPAFEQKRRLWVLTVSISGRWQGLHSSRRRERDKA
jgi:hypothetical protein